MTRSESFPLTQGHAMGLPTPTAASGGGQAGILQSEPDGWLCDGSPGAGRDPSSWHELLNRL